MAYVNKLLLVDGHNLLFKMFFGMPAKILGKDGKAIHALIGFTGALLKVITAVSPTHICVLFDGDNASFRNDREPGYKGTRPSYENVPDQENPFTQLAGIKDCLNYLGIRHYEINSRFEADDIIAAYAVQATPMHTVILSNDKDFFQLVNNQISVYAYNGKSSILYDEAQVYARYGISPAYFADYLSLVGDAADNIRGIPTVGPKTAKKLINAYGNIDSILANAAIITPVSLGNRILEHTETLLHNKALIQLDGQAPLPCDISSLSVAVDTSTKTMEVLKALGKL